MPVDSKLATLTPHLHPTSAAALKAEQAGLLRRARALVEANAANRDPITNVLGSTRATVNYLQALQRNASGSNCQAAPRVVVRRVDRQAWETRHALYFPNVQYHDAHPGSPAGGQEDRLRGVRVNVTDLLSKVEDTD